MERIYELYVLCDPRNNEFFYVGIGKKGRSTSHLPTTRNLLRRGSTLKGRHIRIAELIAENLSPTVLTLETGLTKLEALDKEISKIAEIGRADQYKGPLLNKTRGGQWITDCPRTAEWINNMSISQKKAQNTATTKKAKSDALKGLKRTPEQIENIRQSQLAISDKVSKARMGSGNPMAKKCRINGITYGSLTEAAIKLDVKPWLLRKRFNVELP